MQFMQSNMLIIMLNKSNSFNLQQWATLNNYERNLTDKPVFGGRLFFV